jgi:VWFA-related protein
VRIKFILTFVIVCVLAAPLLLGQSISEDEIKIANQAYVPQEPGMIRVESNLVDVDVVVRDSQGRAVAGLTKNDFEVYDTGKKQPIILFNVELANPPPPAVVVTKTTAEPPPPPPAPPPPRYVGFYFDDVNMASTDIANVRKAAETYINKNLEQNALGAVFTSSIAVTQPFTDDKQKLIAAIEKISSHEKSSAVGAWSCPRIEPYQAWQIMQDVDMHTPAFDLAMAEAIQCNCLGTGDTADCEQQQSRLIQTQAALVLSISENAAQASLGVLGDVLRYMGKMSGHRMLVMCSSGFFARSDKIQKAQDKMIDAAVKDGVTINTLDAKGLTGEWLFGDPANGPPIDVGGNGAMQAYQDEVAFDEQAVAFDPLESLAEGTGGRFFHNNNDITEGVRQIAALPDVSYVIGFSPEDLKEDGGYHTIKVRIPGRGGLAISARPGYYAPSNQKGTPLGKFEKLNREVLAADIQKGFPANISAQDVLLGSGEPAVKISVHVDVHAVPFKKEDDRRKNRLIFITSLFDSQNHFLTGAETVMDMSLKEATLDQIVKQGVDAKLTLQAAPGDYKLREVIQEVVGGKMTTITRPVEIRAPIAQN